MPERLIYPLYTTEENIAIQQRELKKKSQNPNEFLVDWKWILDTRKYLGSG
ncbi:MAG: hypothetical protein WD431_22100 [Cyclobacteriaceae bacterium]